ncbi:MAG TPA: YhcH/YjgK/YiaL family protein [Brevefilum sp.]|nr:YhcH/YjgK/YiaL family protein [Brevefilum sp.]
MIIGKLHDVIEQAHQSPNIARALDYLTSVNPDEIPDGRYLVDGQDVIAIFSRFTTTVYIDDVEVEGHRKYIDIYYLISGNETIAWASVDPMDASFDYHEDNDVWKKVEKVSDLNFFSVEKGDVAILFPSDAHAPQISKDHPIEARKIILKVAVL